MNLLECVELIEETKENSKNALIEKGLELDESYKLSDVDEKIIEIQAGGGGFNFIENVTLYYGGPPIENSSWFFNSSAGDAWFDKTLKFTPKVENVDILICFSSYMTKSGSSQDPAVTTSPEINIGRRDQLTKGTEYSIKFNSLSYGNGFILFINSDVAPYAKAIDKFDVLGFSISG